MLSNKFIKFLVIANGLIILTIAVIALLFMVSEFARDFFGGSRYDEPAGVIVGNELDKAKEKNLALQGIIYDSPQEIYNSTNFFVTVNVKNYKEARELVDSHHQRDEVSLGLSKSSYYNYFPGYINIVFLDENYQPIIKLLNKKGVITEYNIPQKSGNLFNEIDTTVKNIAYKLAFEDTNKDGKLDSEDDQDLYISDLSGKNLTQVTENIDIERYNFQNEHKEIFIEYYERGDDSEYKRKKFLIYDIATKTSRKLESLEKALDEIEAQLVN
ncbi:hypothetical protein R9C00_26285 [Flammeovirgaceae bacterium SG7u.111]|nr:hypothetical protein [Flammeovirgaceae bacterium SG7u.132]WPO35208.1 hypothetical protein R9C00_26285 [Flammeovirgaceae bacterium SG7u.111]